MIVHDESSLRLHKIPTTAGRAPISIALPFSAPSRIVALGGDMKCCIYALKGDRAWQVESFENLGDSQNYRSFAQVANAICAELEDDTLLVAHDSHPALLTTAFAQGQLSQGARLRHTRRCVPVQHHHAHVVSCAIENGVTGPVVGIACDGNGFGADGHNWGCEVLVAEPNRFTRFGHLDYFFLPGGDAAALEPWRCALSLLWQAFEGKPPAHVERIFAAVPRAKYKGVKELLARRVACPLSSSMGRLFDAVSFLCGLCEQRSRDGHAARLLESVADSDAAPYPYLELTTPYRNTIDARPLIQAICCDLTEHVGISLISGRFHATIANALATLALRATQEHNINSVVLSGGCFMNRLLSNHVLETLHRGGVKVLEHQRVSCGDAGLGLGQAVIAAARNAKE